MRIDDNLELAEGRVQCRHCGKSVGTAAETFADVLWREAPLSPDDRLLCEDPAHYVDGEIITRMALCPGCLTLLSREVVPRGEPFLRSLSLLH